MSRLSNVHFTTFEHRSESLPAPLVKALKPADRVQTRDEQVATDVVLISNSSCQTSPPKLISIFAQTEHIVVSKEQRMVSVAVQSSPEIKTVSADHQVQTDVVQFRSVAIETTLEFSEPKSGYLFKTTLK